MHNPFLGAALRRTLGAMTRTAVRAGARAIKQSLKPPPAARKASATKQLAVAGKAAQKVPSTGRPEQWLSGKAASVGGIRRFHLYRPPGTTPGEKLPLLVMLHGCLQDARALAAVSGMNRVAARQRFMVLYPEQDRLSNSQRCWNWFDTRSGRAQTEAGILEAAIDQTCLAYPVDKLRVVLAGLSAGAGMAALLATRRPEQYCAVAMHSGIAPGVASSSATALRAMRGGSSGKPALSVTLGTKLPALLVIQGCADSVVRSSNAEAAVQLWAGNVGASAALPRTVQRGSRYAATVTDYRLDGQLVATLCLVDRLGHSWSGGAAGHAYSDIRGPDASRMIWAFATKQFAAQPILTTGPIFDSR